MNGTMHNPSTSTPTPKRLAALGVSAILLSTSACAGSKTEVGFDGTTTPISMSSSLHDEQGAVIDGDDYQVLRHFETEHKRSWAIFYTGVRFQKRLDFSEEINAAVSKADGEGVVNLEVMTKSCGMNMVIPMILLPFWPGCVRVWVSGDVMTRGAVADVADVADVVQESGSETDSPVPESPQPSGPDGEDSTDPASTDPDSTEAQ